MYIYIDIISIVIQLPDAKFLQLGRPPSPLMKFLLGESPD